MLTRLTILVAGATLALSPCANAQPACSPFWSDSSVAIERSGAPGTIVVHSHAVFPGMVPEARVVDRTGNQFTITYSVNPLGTGMETPWDDAVALGTLPPGTYTVTVLFDTLGGGSVCTIESITFLVASTVPTLSPLVLAAFSLTLGVLGYGLLIGRGRGV